MVWSDDHRIAETVLDGFKVTVIVLHGSIATSDVVSISEATRGDGWPVAIDCMVWSTEVRDTPLPEAAFDGFARAGTSDVIQIPGWDHAVWDATNGKIVRRRGDLVSFTLVGEVPDALNVGLRVADAAERAIISP